MKTRKILAAIMAIAMIASMMSVGVYAADENVYEVSDDATLATAIASVVDGDTIKLAAGTYTGGINIGKEVTLEGSVDEDGNPTTVFTGDNGGSYYAFSIYMNKGTIKNIKITNAWKGIMTEGKGSLTIDNVTMVEIGYGIHIAEAKSADDTVTVQNSNIDITWANSFAGGEYKVIMKNNVLTANNPYYGAEYGANVVNTFAPNTVVEDNVFEENAKILIREEAKEGAEIGANYYAGGFDNVLSEDCATGVQIKTYYETEEMTEVINAPTARFEYCQVNSQDQNGSFITIGLNDIYAEESIKFEIYDTNDVLLATAEATDKVFDELTFPLDAISAMASITYVDEYWSTVWEDGKLRADYVPAKAVLTIDGAKIATAEVKMTEAWTNDSIEWIDVPGVAPVATIGDKGYASLAAAFDAAEDEDVIDLLGNTVVFDTTLNADKEITIKNGTLDATDVEFTGGFGVLIDTGIAITFEDVDFILDDAKAYQGFFYNQGTVTFNGGSVVADGTDAPAIFHGGEVVPVGTFVINGTEITLSSLVNGEGGGRGFLYPTLDIDDAVITMTNLTDNAMRSVSGTIDNSEISVDGAEYGIKNKGFDGVLTVTNSEITIANTTNEDGANAGIYLESEAGLVADENSAINSSMYIPAADENSEPTIYYVLTFAEDEFAAVRKLNGEIIDLNEYVPTLEGYTFSGWYLDVDLTEAIETVVLDADKTVYAAWTKNRTSSGNGGLQAGGDTSNKGADNLGQKDETDDKTEEQIPVTPVTPAAHPFVDVNDSHWFDDAVEYVYKNNLMNGTSEDKFSPNATLTRAMLVTVLYRAEGAPATNKSIPFGDVDMGAYYADAVIWAKQNGIVNGVTENEFAPNASITREQIAAIIYRYASFKGYDMSPYADLTGFTDAKSVSGYAVDAMKYAVGAGIINGKTATTVNPLDNATRAEIAAILQRFIEGNK